MGNYRGMKCLIAEGVVPVAMGVDEVANRLVGRLTNRFANALAVLGAIARIDDDDTIAGADPADRRFDLFFIRWIDPDALANLKDVALDRECPQAYSPHQ
jgi:hypothetical protein